MPYVDIPNFKTAESWFWKLGQKHPKSFAIGFAVAGVVLCTIIRWIFS